MNDLYLLTMINSHFPNETYTTRYGYLLSRSINRNFSVTLNDKPVEESHIAESIQEHHKKAISLKDTIDIRKSIGTIILRGLLDEYKFERI